MDLPGLHHKTFHSHAKAMYSKLDMLEDRVFGQTVAYVREVHAKHSGTTLAEDDVLNISVSFDGTWLTRGHSCVVDLLTGLCIDARHVYILPGLWDNRPEVAAGQARQICTMACETCGWVWQKLHR